jgi:ribose transport system substrate-binding protein
VGPFLQGNKDIQAVFAHNDEMALGALQAIQSSGKKIAVVGFDATDDAVKAVNDGKLTATVAQKPGSIGDTAVKTALKVLKGEQVEKFIPVELELITKNKYPYMKYTNLVPKTDQSLGGGIFFVQRKYSLHST